MGRQNITGSFTFFKLLEYSLQSAVFIILYVQSEVAVYSRIFTVVCCFHSTVYTVRNLKIFFKIFAKFTGKHLCWTDLKTLQNLIKLQAFFTEHLWANVSLHQVKTNLGNQQLPVVSCQRRFFSLDKILQQLTE